MYTCTNERNRITVEPFEIRQIIEECVRRVYGDTRFEAADDSRTGYVQVYYSVLS